MKRLKKKDLLLLAKKLIEKMSHPHNAEKNHHSLIRKKPRKSVKQSEIITCQPISFENANIVNIKSVITKHPKTLHKLSKAIRQAEKVGSNSSLYDTKKVKIFETKKSKNKKKRTCFERFCKCL